MADNHFESGGGEERVWDEYDWERFLQQQDRKTEKYMELLEKYSGRPEPRPDHRARDGLASPARRERQGLDRRSGQPLHAEPALGQGRRRDEDEDEDGEMNLEGDEDDLDDDDEDDEDDLDDEEDEDEDDEMRPTVTTVTRSIRPPARWPVYVDQLFDETDPAAQHPAAARLTTSVTLANVKLAAALTDDDVDELGMTIAYLKRALKAATNALDATAQCEHRKADRPRGCPRSAHANFSGARRHHSTHGSLPQRVAASVRPGALSQAFPRRPSKGVLPPCLWSVAFRSRLPSFLLNGARDRTVRTVQRQKVARLTAPGTEPEDLALVRRCQAGDNKAFDELVTKYRSRAFAMIYHLVHNEQDAWDLAQDGFSQGVEIH